MATPASRMPPPELPVPVFVDNSGIVALALNPVDHKTNKHMAATCFYVRELIGAKVIAPQRVPSEDNCSDLLTKPLSQPLFLKHASKVVAPRGGVHCMMMVAEDQVGPSDFAANWPFLNILQRELRATGAHIYLRPDTFSTGRAKYEVVFYATVNGETRLISTHIGMRFTSKRGAPYYVCQRAVAAPTCKTCNSRLMCAKCASGDAEPRVEDILSELKL